MADIDKIQAIGVVPAEKGGVKVISKKVTESQKPAKGTSEVTFHGGKSARRYVNLNEALYLL